MANKKFSDLTAASSLAAGDLFAVENAGGNSRKITAANVRAFMSAEVLIQEVVTASSQSNVEFSSIAATYRDLIVRVRGRGTDAANNVDIGIRFNNDTTSGNYLRDYVAAIDTSITTADDSVDRAYIGQISAGGSTANYAGYAEAVISNYRNTSWFKAVNAYGFGPRSSTQRGQLWMATLWLSATAISEIDVFPAASAFADGTVVSLYGRY